MSRRVAIIGHTGQGDFGHSLEQAFVGVEGAEIVALADPDAGGRRQYGERTGARSTYADYREMLAAEKPDIAVLATHEMSGHLQMVLAAAAVGAHVYVEKPLATTLGEVDRMLDACERAGVLLVMAHPWRGRPQIQQHAIPMIRQGEIGEPRWVRLYGHPPAGPGFSLPVASGDLWMIDLYPHLFDFACQLFGTPLWCQSLITRDGRPATPADRYEGPFGMGPTAGNGIAAQYQFDTCTVEFVSYWAASTAWRHGESLPYGAEVHGTAGTLCLSGPTIEGSARRQAAGVRPVPRPGRPAHGGDDDRRASGSHPRCAGHLPGRGDRQPVRKLAVGADVPDRATLAESTVADPHRARYAVPRVLRHQIPTGWWRG